MKTNPSQPSLTNLSDELDKALENHLAGIFDALKAQATYGQTDAWLTEQLANEHRVAKSAITAAYAEAINEIIGSDEQHAAYTDNNEAYNGSVFTRNHLRAEQRQRLKGLLTNGKDGDE